MKTLRLKRAVLAVLFILLPGVAGLTKAMGQGETSIASIGVGSSLVSGYLPIYSYYNYSLSQQIYTAEELGFAGAIYSISFFNTQTERTRNIDLYLVHTNKLTFDNDHDWIYVAEVDRVFTGNVTFLTNEWTTIELDNPFIYDGISNLAIMAYDHTGTWYSPALSFMQFGASNQAVHVHRDSAPYDPLNAQQYNGSVDNVKNQLQIGYVTGDYTFYTIHVTAGSGGVALGGGTKLGGSTCTVKAVPESYSAFSNWTENGVVVSTDEEYTFTVTGNRDLVANFELASYTINATADPIEGGTVTGMGTFVYGETATLTASAAEDYIFVNWTENGEEVSTDEVYSFMVLSDRDLVANFYKPAFYNITVSPNPVEGGYIEGTGSYQEGTEVTLTANPNPGYGFYNWTVLSVSLNVDFESGLPAGWTIIDANNDGLTWTTVSDIPSTWTYYSGMSLDWYHSGTNAICSGSYINGVGSIYPDEYLVTPQVEPSYGSTFSFWAAAADAGYPADHFGVFVSTTGTNPSDFVSVQEWTLTSKNGGKDGGRASRNSNGAKISTWYNYVVDLSAYAGQSIYIAIRHFNCYDQYIMCVDDITFVTDRSSAVVSTTNPYSFTATCDRELEANFIPVLSSISDDFEDGEINADYWLSFGSDVVEEEGLLKLYQNATDANVGLLSVPMCVTPNNQIIMERRFFLHKGYYNYYGGFAIEFNGDTGVHRRPLNTASWDGVASNTAGVDYLGIVYGHADWDGKYGIYLEAGVGSETHGIRLCDVVLDTWISEAVVVDLSSGKLLYYLDDTHVTTVDVPNLADLSVNYYTVLFSPYGSYYSHYQFMDDVNINTNLDASYTITATAVGGGTVSGGGEFQKGQACTLTATANEDYTFAYWTDNDRVVSTEAEYTFLVVGDHQLVAHFFLPLVITVAAAPEEGGTVTGSGEYDYGTECTLIATDNEDYYFINWTKDGEVVSIHAEYSFTVTEDGNYVAHFAPRPVGLVTAKYDPDPNDNQSPYVRVCWSRESVLQETFESGGFDMNGWVFPDSYPWVISNNNPIEGYYCMKSGNDGISNSTSSAQVTVIIPNDGEMSFWSKASTEQNYDMARFYIDGQEMGRWSGNGGWEHHVYDITAGEHTFKWLYSKDSSINTNDDCFYVDNISFLNQSKGDRAVNHYAVYRNGYPMNGTPELIASNVTDTCYVDTGWSDLNEGWYLYGVKAVYSESVDDSLYMSNMMWSSPIQRAYPHTINATANPEEGGSVTGAGVYVLDTECTLTAVPNANYTFINWMENDQVISTESTYTFTVTGDRDLVAYFSLPLPITVEVDPSGYGTVTGTGEYDYGTECTLTAEPYEGYTFMYWMENGNILTYNPMFSFTVTSDRHFVAHFCPMLHVNVTANPEAGGIVTGDGEFDYRAECTLTAIPNEGYYFLSWVENGVVVSTDASYTFTVTEDRDLVANFVDGFIAHTYYDWQTNQAAITRTVTWPDGKVNFGFTMASDGSYSDRGTGIGTYVFANDEWIPSEGRVEDERTGFGSIARYGANGIVVAAHTADECHVFIVPDKDNIPVNAVSPVSCLDNTYGPAWPNVMTSGSNRQIIHVIATASSGTIPGMENVSQPVVYFRSTDGGQTWDKQNVVLPYMDADYCLNWGSNKCYWMETTDDNCLALVVNNAWSDGMVIYSYDDGETWQRKVFYKHPDPFGYFDDVLIYPRWTSCQWDSQHRLHVLYEFNATDGSAGSTSLYPAIGGVAYWNEAMPYNSEGTTASSIEGNLVPGQPFVMELSYLNYDIFRSWWHNNYGYADAHEMWPEYVGYLAPLTDDGDPEDPYQATEFNIQETGAHGQYNSGICSFPVLCMVPGTDEMVAVWSALDENHTDANGRYYYKLFASYSNDGGVSWSPMVHLTHDAMFNNAEFIYNQAAVVGRKLIIATQTDAETGSYVMNADYNGSNNFYKGFVFDIDALFDTSSIQKYSITATANPAGGGTVSGAGMLAEGSTCLLTATPNEGFDFVNWTENSEVVSTEATYSFIVTGDRDLVAHFVSNLPDVDQELMLTSGWNWISSYVEYRPESLAEMQELIASECESAMVKSQNDGYVSYAEEAWTGSLSTMDNAQMYLVLVDHDMPLMFFGPQSNPAGHSITLKPGWNWIGYPLTVPMELSEALSGLQPEDGDLIKGNSGYAIYDALEDKWAGNLTTLEPGKGYIYLSASEENRVFVFPFSNEGGGGNTMGGAINGVFTVNDNGDQVYFSKGNLQYQASTNTWRFAENQWDCVGDDNANISQNYSGWIDLFGWGTSGYDHGAVCYQPWSTSTTYSDYYVYGSNNYNLFDQTGQADWGYNAISNGGNQENSGWRTLTQSEWDYLFYTRETVSGIRWSEGSVNGVNGMILLPNDWDASVYDLNDPNGGSFGSNTITTEEWMTVFEANGAVFLPVTGSRYGTSVFNVGSRGRYWSASCDYYMYFEDGSLSYGIGYSRLYGNSVRLVRSAQ